MRFALLVLAALLLSGCASYPIYNSPKDIVANGKLYITCLNSIVVNTDSWFGETTFSVSFTARNKWSDTQYYEDEVYLRGVHHLEIIEPGVPNELCRANLSNLDSLGGTPPPFFFVCVANTGL
jgi:hypothetical protein